MPNSRGRITVRALTGEKIAEALDSLATLRVEVFRAFPYLYDGDPGYERRYLGAFAASPGAVIVAAFDSGEIVGMATAAPLATQNPEFCEPLRAAGYDVSAIFYFGESVLMPDWRGRGIGHAFFDLREAAARRAGARMTAFCAVVRPQDHPAKPDDYSPLDEFWRGRGYHQLDGMTTRFPWKDVGESMESEKPMQFWMRQID